MRRLLASLAALSLFASPVLADPEIKQWNTLHSMGCMLVGDCTDGVDKIESFEDIEKYYQGASYDNIKSEFTELLHELKRIGVNVYVADGKYFPRSHRGVYHTQNNNFYLNVDYIWDEKSLLEVTRHEGWHSAQDCMAGSLDNNSIAVIWNDGVVPNQYQIRASVAYAMMPHAIPWEKEAMWASEEPYQTVNALKACNNPNVDMWTIYPPTPMTGEWLIDNGYWDGQTK